jgi:hypothetical protein
MTAPVWYALSIKQPWAALIVAGHKTVEVRTWGTARRGPLLIHASKTPDPRPEGWAAITPDLQTLSNLGGGIIGVAELTGCIRYETPEIFAADVTRHRNRPDWFQPPHLFGLEFSHPRPLPFRPQSGKTFFFPVEGVPVFAPETRPPT